jgi:hypothetical protein
MSYVGAVGAVHSVLAAEVETLSQPADVLQGLVAQGLRRVLLLWRVCVLLCGIVSEGVISPGRGTRMHMPAQLVRRPGVFDLHW